MWRATLHSRCTVARASLQLSQLPELAALQPRGLFPPAPSPPARAALHAGLARGLDIVRSLGGGGGGGGGALEHAALRLCASGAEACGRFAAGGAHLASARALATAAAGGAPAARAAAASAADFDTGGGFARAAAAEASLACARLSLWGAGSGGGSSGSSGSAAAADEALSASLAASAGIEEELRHIEGPSDAAAAVALLPNALAHARASALRVLLRALHKGSSAGAAGAAAGGAAAGAAAAPEEDKGGPAASLALALNACGSVEDVLRRALPSEAAAPAAAAPRYLHLRAQAARAQAHQNMACAHLFAAAPLLLPGQRAAELAPRAQSLLTAAHTQLTEALGVVEGALRGAEEGAAAAAAAAGTAPAGTAAPTPPPPLSSQSEAWARLQWDLRAARGELLAARSEASLLGALCLLWASGGGCGHPVSASAVPPGPLFPLSQAEADMAAPVLRDAWKGAIDSLRCFEAAEGGGGSSGGEGHAGAGAPPAAALPPIYCERGLDAGLGAARALRVLAVLNCLEGKSVTAEGAFRAVLERYEALLASQRRAGAWPAPQAPREDAGEQGSSSSSLALAWRDLPPPYQAHLAATLAPYGALLWQWDKRSGEAARASGGGRALLGRAVASWWGGEGSGALLGAGAVGAGQPAAPAPAPGAPDKRTFLSHATLSAALCSAAVGSWGLGLPQDLAAI